MVEEEDEDNEDLAGNRSRSDETLWFVVGAGSSFEYSECRGSVL